MSKRQQDQFFNITIKIDDDDNFEIKLESEFDERILTTALVSLMINYGQVRNMFTDAVKTYWENEDLMNSLKKS